MGFFKKINQSKPQKNGRNRSSTRLMLHPQYCAALLYAPTGSCRVLVVFTKYELFLQCILKKKIVVFVRSFQPYQDACLQQCYNKRFNLIRKKNRASNQPSNHPLIHPPTHHINPLLLEVGLVFLILQKMGGRVFSKSVCVLCGMFGRWLADRLLDDSRHQVNKYSAEGKKEHRECKHHHKKPPTHPIYIRV